MGARISVVMGGAILLFAGVGVAADLTPIEKLGASVFFDKNLSKNENQSCASCHDPAAGWTGPLSDTNAHGAVYEGSIAGAFGNRKPPSAAYATLSPVFFQDKRGLFVGGNFWDGRATGEILGNPAADQAQGPFLNPVEQALPDSACVVYRVCNSLNAIDYPVSFQDVWGAEACDINWPGDVETTCESEDVTVALSEADRVASDTAYANIALSIAAYEDSPEVNAFTSKFDQRTNRGAKLSRQEQRGLALFRGKGKCARCHTANGQEPLFTDFTFDNLGIPQNPENPAGVAEDFVDPGLGEFLQKAGYPDEVVEEEWGKQKVPTLRNVGKGSCEAEPDNPDCIVKAYGHNGYFKSLDDIVHFYNTRDVKDTCPLHENDYPYTAAEAIANNCWPEPEVSENVNTDELGDLGLSWDEEDAIVAFLMTLSDGFDPDAGP
jgi:cytochrome c peroxidase